MNTEQTNKAISKSIVSLIMLGVVLGLFGLIGSPILLYYYLGKLEPNNLRVLSCSSICLLPILAGLSFAFSFMLYKANRKGQDNAIEFASQSWEQVAGGIFKVNQARQPSQPRPPSPVPAYPAFWLPAGARPQAGMVIEQRQVPGPEFYE